MSKFDDEYRAGVVVMLQSEGYPDDEFALGRVHQYLKQKAPYPTKTTISNWFHGVKNPPPSKKVDDKKDDIVESMKEWAWALLNHGKSPATISEMTGQQAATSFGIILDKIQLLEGKATTRSDVTLTQRNLPPLPEDTLGEILKTNESEG